MEKQPTILCVDDYPSLLRTLAMALAGLGFEVLTASNLAEALTLARENHIDAVLLEYRLCPGCDLPGECAANRIKAFRPDTKVLVWSTDDRPIRQPPPCAAATFTKPMDPVELVERIRTLLAGD
jgi:DNA-binding response OmpR family regulator